MNHKKFRALLKKFRRKFKRQAVAKLREEQKVQNEISSEDETEENFKLEEEEKERERQHILWLEREKEAEELFKKQQELKELQKKREEEIKKIKDDFILNQNEKQIKIDEKKEQKLKLLESLNQNLKETNNDVWHNPIAPENYNVQTKESCSFFLKTGCCRFGERCSRSHPRPEISHTLLIKGMYSHFSIEQSNCDDYDADCNLEYEDSETYHHFCEFYDDVLPEFKKAGRVIQFKVCCNHEPHLRGNVYIQFSKQEEAEKAFRLFNTRWYGGKQLSCEFTNVIKWKSAICVGMGEEE